MKRTIFCLGFFLFLALSSCTSLSLEPPELQLANIEFSEATLFETTLEADVRYENPNSEELRVKSAIHKLTLNGIDVGKGFHRKTFVVPAYGNSVEAVVFRLSNIEMLTKVQSLVNSPSFKYAVESKLRTESGSFSLSNSGSIVQ